MKWPKKAGVLRHTPDHPKSQLEAQNSSSIGFAQACADCGRIVRHLSPSETHERESHALLCLILRKLAEIQATLASPLVKRQLWPRFCVGCGVLVTNRNCGGFSGRSALTGKLYCTSCADEIGGAP